MSYDVTGKTALVTGANRGIGKAIVDSLIQHDAARVYAAVRNIETAKPLVDQYGEKVEPVHVDLSKAETIRAAAKTAGDVQVVINNGGVLHPATPLDKEAVHSLQQELEVNVFGLIHMAQAFAPVLEKNGGGAFVQLNSVVSVKCFADFSTYCASKAAAYSITQALRDLLRKQGTAVLSVHPGPIATDMAGKAGLSDMAEPPSLVAEGIVSSLKAGDFHLFPDTMARKVESAYRDFAERVVERDSTEG